MEATRTVPSTCVFKQFQRRLKFVPAMQHIAAHIEIQLARFGDCQRTRAAVQQRDAQLLLQILQILAGSRLADAVHRGALANTARLCYIPEKLEAIKIHRPPLY